MKSLIGCVFVCLLLICSSQPSFANNGGMIVFLESGFAAADSATPDGGQLHALFPSASFANAQELKAALLQPNVSLLVLPYGSAFPEECWVDIHAYLSRGGNLLAIGGRPFTRAAYRTNEGWKLRDYNVRFVHELNIDQYQEEPGSDGLTFESNPDLTTQIAPFTWKRGFGPVIRLSSGDVYQRQGSAGALDARLDAFAWGLKDTRRMSVPAIQIDHVRSRFVGGRWVFVNSELAPDFFTGEATARNVAALAEAASRGAEEFTARPTLPLYAAGEPIQVELNWLATRRMDIPLTAQVTLTLEGQAKKAVTRSVRIAGNTIVTFPATATKGLHRIDAKLLEGERVIAVYHSAFWLRDEAYLRSGPKLSVNQDYFELDGHPLAVVGTTYMASDVQRLFFDHPNVYVWDKELGQISDAGLNMIRTGWWTGWDKLCDETGRPYDRTLRTLEAYLMTARRRGLPVQFNFFAFLPEVLGGTNAYLDPEAVRRQKTLIAGVAERFRDVPFVAWDLINEPSFSRVIWKMRPNSDPIEFAQWNDWLRQRYPDRGALAHGWNMPSVSADTVALPGEAEFAPRSMYQGPNSLKLYDFFTFAQLKFADWAMQMRQAIRATGSQQLITIGQDEGGYDDRLSPAFFGPAVDFTANHSWWQNDSLLWDSLVAKQPGKALLIQETGLQRELNMDELARRTVESEGALFERKMAMSFVQASGAIQWLWNSNTYMDNGNEAPIGALRADGSEKPEATVLRDFGAFAKKASDSLRNPQQPPVAIISSQAAQFSVVGNMQVEAQRKAVRAVAYNGRTPAYLVAENQIANMGLPKLAILPSAQALDEPTWQALLKYVNDGGNLLVTGPVARDAHWRKIDRLPPLSVTGEVEPLTYKTAAINAGGQNIRMSFDLAAQSWLESVRFADGNALQEKPYGKGRMFWAAYPVELAEGLEPASKLYSYVLQKAGVAPMFQVQGELSPGVLVYPTVLQDAVMYVFVSDEAADSDINVTDGLTGSRMQFRLPSQRAAIKILRRTDGREIASYEPK